MKINKLITLVFFTLVLLSFSTLENDKPYLKYWNNNFKPNKQILKYIADSVFKDSTIKIDSILSPTNNMGDLYKINTKLFPSKGGNFDVYIFKEHCDHCEPNLIIIEHGKIKGINLFDTPKVLGSFAKLFSNYECDIHSKNIFFINFFKTRELFLKYIQLP